MTGNPQKTTPSACKISPTARKHGFTLVELLVVIAIIAVLSAVAYPVFLKMRTKGDTAGCISNLKQIGVYKEMIEADNMGRQFWRYRGTWNGEEGDPDEDLLTWTAAVQEVYADNKDWSIFMCPAYKRKYSPANWHRFGNSYAHSRAIAVGSQQGSNPNWVPFGFPLYRVKSPATTVLIYDAMPKTKDNATWVPSYGPYTDLESNDKVGNEYHKGSHNALFVDGHVENIRAKSASE